MSKQKQTKPTPIKQNQENNSLQPAQKYFSKFISNQTSQALSTIHRQVSKQIKFMSRKIMTSIRKGQIHIKGQPDDLKQILFKQKINQQEVRAQQLKRKKQEVIQALKRLDMRQNILKQSPAIDRKYNSIDNIRFVPGGVLTKEEHENMMEKIRRAQEQINYNHERNVKMLQERIQEEQARQKQLEEQKFINDRQMRKMKSEHNMGIRRETFEKKMSQQIDANKQLRTIKNSSPLYKVKEQEFEAEVIAPSLLQKKKKLKQIRDFSRNFSVKQLNKHQKKYIQQRNLSMKQSKIKNKIDQQWTYKPPNRTQNLNKFLQEQLSENKRKLEEKKKNIQQKIRRQQNYVRLLKQKHYPNKMDPQLQQELGQRLQKLHTSRLMTPEKTVRQIGLQNLRIAKNKKQNSESCLISAQNHLERSNISQRKKMFNQFNYLKTKDDPEYYMQVKKRQLDKIILQQQKSPQKQKKLQVQSKKIEDALRMKKQLLRNDDNIGTRNQAAQLMLSSIKTKMGLIQLYQTN